MARFRRSGTNWEGRVWKTSRGLNALMDEIEAAYPLSGPADGTVASKSHSKNSDHYPDSAGIVRAVDAGEYVENQGIVIADAIRKSRDPRVKYVIHEGRLFSSYNHSNGPAWSWRPYTGTSNPHENHVHVSLNTRGDTDGSAWNLELGGEKERMEELVLFIQESLKAAGIDPGPLDGLLGPKTKAALTEGFSGGKGEKGDKGDRGPAGADGKDGADGTLIIKGTQQIG